MAGSAGVMAAAGLALQFAPHEVLAALATPAAGIAPLLAQVAGALYLGFAVLNWLAQAILLGGIYARPVALANFAHFLIGALTVGKHAPTAGSPVALWTVTGAYLVLALLFGWVSFTHPTTRANQAAPKRG